MFSKSNNRNANFIAKKHQWCSILIFLLFTAFWSNHAQAADNSDKKTVCDPTKEVNCPAGPDPFRGLKWGIGVAYSSSLGGVGDVKVDPVTRVVHVNKQNAGAARGVFEAHYYFKLCNEIFGRWIYLPNRYDKATGRMECQTNDSKKRLYGTLSNLGNDAQFGTGPFVSLNTSPFNNSSGSKPFDSVGMGWMLGLNAYDASVPSLVHSLNIGVGAILDTGVRTLRSGFRTGKSRRLTMAS